MFHDWFNYEQTDPDYLKQFQPPLNGDMMLTADPNNVHVLNIKDMLVFNNQLYRACKDYFQMMPNFSALHSIRKPAGASTVENETFCYSLAFQGSMNIVEDRRVIEQIHQSWHHCPYYMGVSSICEGLQDWRPAQPQPDGLGLV